MHHDLLLSFNIGSLSTCENEKNYSCCLLHISPILCMLRWSLYFTMMLPKIGSQLAYSAILRLLEILGKKIVRILRYNNITSNDFILFNVSFPFDAIFPDKNGLSKSFIICDFFFWKIFWQEPRNSYAFLDSFFYFNQFYFSKMYFWILLFSLFYWKEFYYS